MMKLGEREKEGGCKRCRRVCFANTHAWKEHFRSGEISEAIVASLVVCSLGSYFLSFSR